MGVVVVSLKTVIEYTDSLLLDLVAFSNFYYYFNVQYFNLCLTTFIKEFSDDDDDDDDCLLSYTVKN